MPRRPSGSQEKAEPGDPCGTGRASGSTWLRLGLQQWWQQVQIHCHHSWSPSWRGHAVLQHTGGPLAKLAPGLSDLPLKLLRGRVLPCSLYTLLKYRSPVGDCQHIGSDPQNFSGDIHYVSGLAWCQNISTQVRLRICFPELLSRHAMTDYWEGDPSGWPPLRHRCRDNGYQLLRSADNLLSNV